MASDIIIVHSTKNGMTVTITNHIVDVNEQLPNVNCIILKTIRQ